MKNGTVITILLVFSVLSDLLGQSLKKVETYYDPITRTKIHEAYTTQGTPPYAIHGLYKEWDQDGALEKEIQFDNGKRHGTYKIYYGTGASKLSGRPELLGKVAFISNYTNDVLNGLDQKFDYPNGKQQLVLQKTWVNGKQIKEEEWYSDGKPKSISTENGLNMSWYPNGKKINEVSMKNGVEDGKVTEWYENGKVAFSGEFKEGRPTGRSIVYYEDGTIRKEANYDPTSFKDIHTIEYYPTGKVKWDRVATDASHYTITTYDSLKGYKKIVQGWIDDPKSTNGSLLPDGKMIEYFESGEIWKEINYSNGKIEGVYKVFTKTGEELNGGLVRSGKKVGKWKYHYTVDWEEAFTKEYAAYYRIIDFGNGDLKEWPTNDYFISGNKQFEGFLAGESPDVLSGKCKYYFENGRISQEIEYNTKGKPLSLRIFDEAGKLLQEGTAVDPKSPVTMNWMEYYPNGNIKSKGVLNPTTGIKIGTWTYYDEAGNSTQTLENQH